MKLNCNVSVGEYLDKCSILMVKQKHLSEDKLADVLHELKELNHPILHEAVALLIEIYHCNSKMWDINEKRRDKVAKGELDEEFIELAKAEMAVNDERYKIKQRINERYGSDIVERKSYL
tara:strand:- start:1815 stop:2174 length:360 start_codon:yes stop_codon:yes gene_type:complete